MVDLALGARLGMPSHAVVDEVMPLHEVDGGILEAWTSADTFCLLPAASADTANDTTRAVASVEISGFFMSYLLCPKRHRNANSIAFVPNIFLPEIISTRSSVPSPH